jgi:cytochrome c2
MRSPLKRNNQHQKVPGDSARKQMAGRMILCLAVTFLLLTQAAAGQDIAAYYKQNCSACHWIGGGRLVGPDLQNVSQRGERDWQIRFILNPKAMLDAQDPYVMKLKGEAGGALMTNVPGITRDLAEALLDFIDAESKLDSSQFKGTPKALAPFSDTIAQAGLRLFTGDTRLTNSGPPCMSCHSINADGSGLGGQLGPELTGVFERLRGRTAITAWLSSPPTPTMRTVFKEHKLEDIETKQLAMFFESVDGRTGHTIDSTMSWIVLILLCLVGSAVGLAAFGGIWGKRFRAVRRPLINEAKKQRLL